KGLVTENPAGEPVRVLTFDTGLDEADGIVRAIRHRVEQRRARHPDRPLFLGINAPPRPPGSAVVKHAGPVPTGKGPAFFERKENRDVLAYLRLLVNPVDNFSFLRVVNEPPRGIGKVSLEHLQQYAADRAKGLLAAAADVAKVTAIKGKAVAGLRDFHTM